MALPPGVPTSPDPKRDVSLVCLLALGGTLFFLTVNALLAGFGVVSLESEYFSHRAMLVFGRQDFSLRDAVELGSPLTQSLFLLLRQPVLAPSVIGGGFLVLVVAFGVKSMRAGSFGRAVQSACVLLLLLSPSFLALCAMEPAGCLQLLLCLGAYWLLLLYNDRGYSFHLFSFSILCGLMLYTGWASIAFCLGFAPIVALTARRKNLPVGALLVVYATPLVFVLLSIWFLRWIFHDGGTQVAGLYAHLLSGVSGDAFRGNVAASALQGARLVGGHVLVFMPLAVSLGLSLGAWRALPHVGLALVLWPFLELFGELVTGSYRSFSLVTVVAALSAMLLLRLPRVPLVRRAGSVLMIGALGLWLCLDWGLALQGPPLGANLVARLALGRPSAEAGPDWGRLAERLGDGSGAILLDNSQLYPLLLRLGDPQRFIVPDRPEFEPATTNPAAFARFVVVDTGNIHDRVLKRYPEAAQGTLAGYTLIYRQGDVLAYERR